MWPLESIGEIPQLDIDHRHLAMKQFTSPLAPPFTKSRLVNSLWTPVFLTLCTPYCTRSFTRFCLSGRNSNSRKQWRVVTNHENDRQTCACYLLITRSDVLLIIHRLAVCDAGGRRSSALAQSHVTAATNGICPAPLTIWTRRSE